MTVKTASALFCIALLIAGCTTVTPSTSTPAAVSPTAEPTVAVTETLSPSPTPDSGAIPTGDLISAVQATLPAGALGGVKAVLLSVPSGSRPLWLVHTFGLRSFESEPIPEHFVAVYTRENDAWNELARLNLSSQPDYVDQNGPRQAQLDPARIWIEVPGGAGAHSGAYELLSFDGVSLRTEVAGFNASPDAGRLEDLNGDGVPEVVLNESDPYVFCYACGVRFISFGVRRWNARQQNLEQVALMSVPANAPGGAPNNRAIELANAGLWKDALAQIDEARAAVDPNAPEAAPILWNHALIKLHAGALVEAIANGPYPLLSNIFYGDFAAAVDIMRAYTPQQIFDPQSPLIAGTPAEGWLDSLTFYVTAGAGAALAYQPDTAPAHFLHGWAQYLSDPTSVDARASVERSAQLAPADQLFSASAAYLASVQPPPAGQPQRIAFAPGSTQAVVESNLNAGETKTFSLRASAGQTMLVDVSTAQTGLALAVIDPATRQPLPADLASTISWRGRLPATQDYFLQVTGSSAAAFSLNVIIPRIIAFETGAISAVIDDAVTASQTQFYTLRARAGQTMTVNILSPNSDVLLTIYGLDDGQPLVRSVSGATDWTGTLPATQDYMIQAVSVGPGTAFTLRVTIQ